MLSSNAMTFRDKTDAELVGAALGGDRDAFGEIVRRYQSFVCSLAYSATGDLSRSEDLAQETFLAAWQRLGSLREPAKFRGWLSGIARHRIQDAIRSRYHEPSYRADSLDEMHAVSAPDAAPADQAATSDEAAIVWRALERIPESYREPLILFHREGASVARVAELLDLSADAVKQRLVRGRKLLQAEVEAVVEGALRRTAPGTAFTANVLKAVPIGGAVKVTIGTGAATKSLSMSGAAGLLTACKSALMPVAALLIEWRRMRGYEAEAAFTDERAVLATHRRVMLTVFGVAITIGFAVALFGQRQSQATWFAPMIGVAVVVGAVGIGGLQVVATRRRLARVWQKVGRTPVKRGWEYRTSREALGRPWIHIRLGFSPRWARSDKPVKAWIAIGHVAHGLLFAAGGVAVAPVSLGGFTAGLVSVGVFSVGVFAIGGLFGVGYWAFGIIAAGWMASGLIALGLEGAFGLHAYARTFAACPPHHFSFTAYAPHANDDLARTLVAQNGLLNYVSQFLTGNGRPPLRLFIGAAPLTIWELVWEFMKGRPWPRTRSAK